MSIVVVVTLKGGEPETRENETISTTQNTKLEYQFGTLK